MIATLVSVYGIQFVHFIFGEADRAELGDVKAKAEDNQKSKTTGYGPIKSTN